MAEENKDSKPVDGQPAGNDLPEKNGSDRGAGQGNENKNDQGGEEMVTIPKSKLDKLVGTNESYRKAVIRLNRQKGRTLPGADPVNDNGAKKDEEDESEDDDGFLFGEDGKPKKKPGKASGDVVTKSELSRRDQQLAIDLASEDPVIDENWDEIVAFYEKPADQSVRSYLKAIRSAKAAWQKLNPPENKPDDAHKKLSSELGSDAGSGKGREKTVISPRKHVIPQKSDGMKGWFKKKEE